MILPEHLHKGDTIGIIAPASPVKFAELKKGISFFEGLGLHVKLGEHIDRVHGYLAGTDRERLTDLHDMFADPHVKAIICARGGYGTGRIAAAIDYDLIRQNPKIFWGYSDITYLHTAIRQKTGLVTFHGPMVASDIAKDNFDALSARLFEQLFCPIKMCYTEEISPLHTLVPGEATGELVGGNLSLLVSMMGTGYEIDTKGKLLFIEDIGEEPYRVDGMLNQLKLAGKLSDAAGIIIGDFSWANPRKGKPSLSLGQVFQDYVADLSCPVMSGFKIGHCMPHFSIPLGVCATLSTSNKTLMVDVGVR
ncbi:S66 peptidase family protein [Lentibacillus sp. Marseille-P4043]|uniref:S66 peptidase family protein n=1 Tax=Lentibacillus sp. Marseille-P4043 TaxID=2040293 RepID=UPI000D0B4BE3|nr:LD-carboxypeptidase [Lentibacillus sp. Marseille-P4043]